MGKTLTPGRAPSEAEWQDFAARRPAPLVYAVATTGIFCRSGCPARTPNRPNVSLFDTAEAARAAGFRACKRCWPGRAAPVA